MCKEDNEPLPVRTDRVEEKNILSWSLKNYIAYDAPLIKLPFENFHSVLRGLLGVVTLAAVLNNEPTKPPRLDFNSLFTINRRWPQYYITVKETTHRSEEEH